MYLNKIQLSIMFTHFAQIIFLESFLIIFQAYYSRYNQLITHNLTIILQEMSERYHSYSSKRYQTIDSRKQNKFLPTEKPGQHSINIQENHDIQRQIQRIVSYDDKVSQIFKKYQNVLDKTSPQQNNENQGIKKSLLEKKQFKRQQNRDFQQRISASVKRSVNKKPKSQLEYNRQVVQAMKKQLHDKLNELSNHTTSKSSIINQNKQYMSRQSQQKSSFGERSYHKNTQGQSMEVHHPQYKRINQKQFTSDSTNIACQKDFRSSFLGFDRNNQQQKRALIGRNSSPYKKYQQKSNHVYERLSRNYDNDDYKSNQNNEKKIIEQNNSVHNDKITAIASQDIYKKYNLRSPAYQTEKSTSTNQNPSVLFQNTIPGEDNCTIERNKKMIQQSISRLDQRIKEIQLNKRKSSSSAAIRCRKNVSKIESDIANTKIVESKMSKRTPQSIKQTSSPLNQNWNEYNNRYKQYVTKIKPFQNSSEFNFAVVQKENSVPQGKNQGQPKLIKESLYNRLNSGVNFSDKDGSWNKTRPINDYETSNTANRGLLKIQNEYQPYKKRAILNDYSRKNTQDNNQFIQI